MTKNSGIIRKTPRKLTAKELIKKNREQMHIVRQLIDSYESVINHFDKRVFNIDNEIAQLQAKRGQLFIDRENATKSLPDAKARLLDIKAAINKLIEPDRKAAKVQKLKEKYAKLLKQLRESGVDVNSLIKSAR